MLSMLCACTQGIQWYKMRTRSYSELIRIPSFEERYEYLKLGGTVGRETFGFDRYLNQMLYQSREWKRTRHGIILRDDGCDLGISDRLLQSQLLIHHINPISIEDLESYAACIFDEENLITTSMATHNAIHFGDKSLLPILPPSRTQDDTQLWTRR